MSGKKMRRMSIITLPVRLKNCGIIGSETKSQT